MDYRKEFRDHKEDYKNDFRFRRDFLRDFEVKEELPGAYQPWTEELDKELMRMIDEGVNPRDIAKHLGRSKGAIHSRIRKLDLDTGS